MSCTIVYNENNEIETMNAPNGEPSILYRSLLEKTGDKKLAADLTVLTQTEKFRQNIINPILQKYKNRVIKKLGNKNYSVSKRKSFTDLKFSDETVRLVPYSDGLRVDGVSNNGNLQTVLRYGIEQGEPIYYGESKQEIYPSGYFDKNGEPLAKVVVDYVNSSKTKNKVLSQKQKQDIKNSLLSLPFASSQELYESLNKAFYVNGEFTIDKSRLTPYYSEFEISNMLSDTNIQKTIKMTLESLKNSENIYNDTYFNTDFLVKENSFNSLGKQVNLNPLKIENDLIQELGGLDESTYNERKDALELPVVTSFEAMQQFKRMPRFVIRDGVLQRQTKSIKNELVQTLNIANDLSISADIIYINSLPQDIYLSNGQDVQQLIKAIELKAARQGIDIAGANEKIYSKTRDEVYDLLEATNQLILDPTEANIDVFADNYNTFFETDLSPVDYVAKTSTDNKSKSLIYLETTLSEYEAFRDFSLIKADNNIWQRVEKIEDMAILYDYLYQISQYNEGVLPIEAYPFAREGNIINLSTLRNPANKDIILQDIQTFLENNIGSLDEKGDSSSLQQMLAFKYFFNHPTTLEQIDNIHKESANFSAFTGSEAYLTTDFISDFWAKALQEKVKDSDLYASYYSNFGINQGIYLLNADAITIDTIKDYTDENIENYSLLSKNMPDLKTGEIPSFLSRDFYRSYYANYPKKAPKVTLYSKINNTVISTTADNPEFVRTQDGVYELMTTEIDNYYEKINTVQSNYKTYDVSEPELSIDPSRQFKTPIVQNTVNTYYSAEQENQINADNFNCN